MRISAFLVLLPLVLPFPMASKASDDAEQLVGQFCADCHTGDQAEGGVVLDTSDIEWERREIRKHWERVYQAVRKKRMPPAEADRPSEKQRLAFIEWLRENLLAHSPAGGTVLRRLNRDEYAQTIGELFDLPDFEVPESFPADDSLAGFDNVGEGLLISPPLMAQYLKVATAVADEILPPKRPEQPPEPKRYQIGPEGLASNRQGGGTQWGKVFRIVSSRNMASAAAWPNLFEATKSGIYRLTVDASVFQTESMFYERRDTPFRLVVYARPKADQVYAPFGELRQVASFEIEPGSTEPQQLKCDIPLYRGEVFGIRWEDGPCFSDPPVREYSTRFLGDRLKRGRRHYAAMLKLQGGTRGMSQQEYYLATVALMKSEDLDLDDPRLDELPKHYGGGLSDAPHNWVKSYAHEEMFRRGPAIDLSSVQIEGPLELIEDEQMRRRRRRTAQFLRRVPGLSDQELATEVLRRFLPQAFRRPVNEEKFRVYQSLVDDLFDADRSTRAEDALHLAVRRALCSTDFLFRAARPGPFDDFDIASRLSYFLHSAPPDDRLTRLAIEGKLSQPDTLRAEAMRLIADPRSERFVRRFTGQWLGTRRLSDIMPDPRLLKFFAPDRDAMVAETELFFAEVLRENHPVSTLIDPGFSYRNAALNKIYGGDLQGNQMRRVTFPSGGREGGVVTLASVMMATANGVDTHPVHRGVWVLENILGSPTPPPPESVPAIAPDTTGATSMRQQLEAHRADASCAQCHKRIDPIGLVMENFDPVGRWRTNYPVYAQPASEKLDEEFYSTIGSGTKKGPPIDATAKLPDGRVLRDAADLKRFVLENGSRFTECLTEKLMVYGTGRRLDFGDRIVVEEIAATDGSPGLADLIVEVVQSESFLTK